MWAGRHAVRRDGGRRALEQLGGMRVPRRSRRLCSDKQQHTADSQNVNSWLRDLHRHYRRSGSSSQTPRAKQLLDLARPEAKYLIGAMASLVVASGVNLVFPYAMGKVVDDVMPPEQYGGGRAKEEGDDGAEKKKAEKEKQSEKFPFEALAALFVVGAAASFLRVTLLTVATQSIAARLRTRLFGAILSKNTAFYDRHRTGDLISRLSTDTTVAAKGLTDTTARGLRAGVSAAGGTALLVYLSPQLALTALCILPPLGISAAVYGRYVRQLQKEVQEKLADANTVAEERVGSVRLVRAFSGELQELMVYSQSVEEAFVMSRRVAVASGVFFGSISLVVNFGLLGVLGYGGHMVSSGAMTAGDLTSFALYALTAAAGYSGLAASAGDANKAIGAAERVFDLLDPDTAAQSLKMKSRTATEGEEDATAASAAAAAAGQEKDSTDSSDSGDSKDSDTGLRDQLLDWQRRRQAELAPTGALPFYVEQTVPFLMQASGGLRGLGGFDLTGTSNSTSNSTSTSDGDNENAGAAAAPTATTPASAAKVTTTVTDTAASTATPAAAASPASPASPAPALAFRGVDFAYPTRPHVPVFTGLDFDVEAGQTVAVVGASGSGKSSLLSLLLRLYEPQRGEVLLGGADIGGADSVWLRQQLGYVQQEPVLFATSIVDNIRYGDPAATDDAVRAAADAAHAAGFIERLPRGYDTYVGEKGVQLSGGQKQRIAIARAIVRNPSVLVLDEATSALDSESERLVQRALAALSRGRTTLVVAHRLATVMNADKLVVLQDGAVAEEGTHAGLISRGGVYSQLVRSQMSGIE